MEAEIEGFTEEQNQEGGVFYTTEKVNKASAGKLLKELKGLPDTEAEVRLVNDYLKMVIKHAEIKSKIKNTAASLDLLALRKYRDLSEADVKELVIRDKWFQALEITLEKEFQGLLSILVGRVKEVNERYDESLIEIKLQVQQLELAIEKHLKHFLT